MAFSNSFTGKESAVKLEGGGTQAQQGLNQMVIAAEELRYKVYEKNRNEFLQNANIDPVFVLSDSARKYQFERINDFNKVWGKRAQETNYNFSDQDKLNMQTHKNLIMAEQQDQLQQYETWKQHRDLIQRDQGENLSIEEFSEATDEMMKGGRYDLTTPPLRPLDFGDYIESEARKLQAKEEMTMRGIGGGKAIPEYYTLPAGEESRFIAAKLAENPRARKDFFNKWNEADKEKWFRLADENKDNQYSPEEKKNAMLLWAVDTYGKRARPLMRGTPSTIPGLRRGADTTGFDKKLPVSATNNKNSTYDVGGINFGSIPFTTFYSLGGESGPARTQQIQIYVDTDTGEEKNFNSAASFTVVGYSADKDMVIVRITGTDDYRNKTTGARLKVGQYVGLKGSQYDSFLKRDFGFYRTPSKSGGGTTQGTFVTKDAANITPPTFELDNL